MSGVVLEASLTTASISAEDLAKKVRSEDCGAVVTFSGEVRNHDHGRTVLQLKYEIHPTSEIIIREVAHEVASRFTNLRCAVIHRYGDIPIGESALAIAVATPHRGEAFEACATLVDEIKVRVPIWKNQIFDDGTNEWVNSA